MNTAKFIANFREFVQTLDMRDVIAKVILFGSHAKGMSSKESDIDILIFTANGSGTDKSLMDRIYDFMVENSLPLEVITRPVYDFFFTYDYFTFNVIQNGIEIYSMEKSQLKETAVKDILGLCEEYLESAREVLGTNRIRLALDAGYNAAELAAKALILLRQDDLPGSHGGVVSRFGQLYVKTGLIEKEVGRNLNLALKLRNEARYRPDAIFTEQSAQFVLDLAEKLIALTLDKM